MKSEAELVSRARLQATEVRRDLKYQPDEMYDGYWAAEDDRHLGKIRARAAASLEFLRQYAGEDSQWFKRAQSVYDENEGQEATANGTYLIGDVLEAWADSVEEGFTSISGFGDLAIRAVVGTDLMEQVRLLNEDKTVSPAAPIVLAGAALEIALRGAVEEASLIVTGQPSINAYSTALRTADLITKQDKKDIDSVAGLRNSAAHGDHSDLSRERAGMMEQQVNMLLSRLGPLLGR